MLRLNTIFEAEKLDPTRIQLIRHKDHRLKKEGKTVFDIWRSEKTAFEKYQSTQRKKNAFDKGGLVASFVVSNWGETLFVGMYTVERQQRLINGDVTHDLNLTKYMSEYVCRLVIAPWPDAINIVKHATLCDPEVYEIKRNPDLEPFPGLMKFTRRVRDLPNIPSAWQSPLKDAKGIYLLTFADGWRYVGSASGDQGFWQRWNDYVRTGNGGNRILIQEKRDARLDAIISILEVTGSALTQKEIIDREMNWIKKLGSKSKLLDSE